MHLDHVIIRVEGLREAILSFENLGFQVVRGGDHAEGLTENALVYFEDKSFIELIGFTKIAKVKFLIRSGLGYLLLAKNKKHVRYRFGQTSTFSPGLIDAAMMGEDLDMLSKNLSAAGVKHSAPNLYARDTPEGVHLEWQIMCPFDPALPFIRDEYTPKVVVPDEKRNHPNGVTGIRMLHYAATNLDQAATAWSAVGAPLSKTSETEFRLRNLPMTYHSASSNPKWNKWVKSSRSKPVRLDLLTTKAELAGPQKLPEHWHCELNIVAE